MKKVVINTCFGGFGLSDTAYEKLIEYGVPVRKYPNQPQDPQTGRFLPEPANEGEVIFDRELTLLGEDSWNDLYHTFKPSGAMSRSRYWDDWTASSRTHPLLIRVITELGPAANGPYAELKVVDVPDDVTYTIEEYDGVEHIAETHRTWG